MITRENYETYALDFIEGALSVEDHALFVLFLEQNQDLQEEVLSLTEDLPVLSKETGKTLAEKSAWHKKSPIHTGNEDEYLIDSLEGNATIEQEQFLRMYVQEYPHIEKKQKRYAQTILKADLNMVFPKKDRLKKSLLWFYTKQFAPLAVAASILLIWSYSILFNREIKIERQANFNHSYTNDVVIHDIQKDSTFVSHVEKEETTFVQPKKKVKRAASPNTFTKNKALDAHPLLLDIDRLPQQAIASIYIDSTNLMLTSRMMTPTFKHKTYIVEEKNLNGFAFASQLFKQKASVLLAEKKRKQNTEEKQSNVWAWIEKETGIRVFKTQEISNHRVEIAMGNRIEIQSK